MLASEKLAGLEEQLAWSSRVIDSIYFSNQSEEEQARLKNGMEELERQRDEAKKVIEDALDSFANSSSWPIAPPTRVENLMKYILELKDAAEQISKGLNDSDISINKSHQPPLFLPDDSDSDYAATDDENTDGNLPYKNLKKRLTHF